MCYGNGADRRPGSLEPEKSLIQVYTGGFGKNVRPKPGQMGLIEIPKAKKHRLSCGSYRLRVYRIN